MTRNQVNRTAAILPIVLSAFAFAIAMANILADVAPQPDETTSAHLWQLLMVAQLPIIILFLASADWRGRWTTATAAIQLASFAIACLPVWFAGY